MSPVARGASSGSRRTSRSHVDVTDEASSAAFVDAAVAELGGVDILFNNAGLALGRAPFTESTADDEQRVVHTNVDGVMRMTRLVLPHIRDEGHILFMGSIAGRQAYPGGASYIASKFAVRGFSYALREDLLGRPIRITTVDAGLVETEFSLVRFKGDQEKADSVYDGLTPVTPDEVADCVMFALTRPLHVNLDEIVIKAIAQSSGSHVVRKTRSLTATLAAALTVRPPDPSLCDPCTRGARGRAALRPRRHRRRRSPRPLAARGARPRRDRALGRSGCSTSSSTGRRRRSPGRQEQART